MIFKIMSGLILASAVAVFGYFGLQSMTFDYASATPQERAVYLEGKARSMKGAFKPNYLSKSTDGRVSGNQLVFRYNTGMGSLTCGQGVDCREKQCRRYLGSSLAKHNISVRLVYTDNTNRQIGSQSLSAGACRRYQRS